MNFIDFMAILPVFLTMILEGLEDMRVGYYIQCTASLSAVLRA